jgi:hypothetical protein
MEQYVQSLIETTSRPADDLKNTPPGSGTTPPAPETVLKKKKGWFGFLFRAA